MKKLTLRLAGVFAVLNLIAATATTSAVATRPDCFSEGSGHPGCRIVQVSGGRFSVPLVVGSASLWLQLEFECVESDPTLVNISIYHEGTLISVDIGPCGGALGQLLELPGNYVVEYRDATTGELLDTLAITLRSGP